LSFPQNISDFIGNYEIGGHDETIIAGGGIKVDTTTFVVFPLHTITITLYTKEI